jgi:hypothetical protein
LVADAEHIFGESMSLASCPTCAFFSLAPIGGEGWGEGGGVSCQNLPISFSKWCQPQVIICAEPGWWELLRLVGGRHSRVRGNVREPRFPPEIAIPPLSLWVYA